MGCWGLKGNCLSDFDYLRVALRGGYFEFCLFPFLLVYLKGCCCSGDFFFDSVFWEIFSSRLCIFSCLLPSRLRYFSDSTSCYLIYCSVWVFESFWGKVSFNEVFEYGISASVC